MSSTLRVLTKPFFVVSAVLGYMLWVGTLGYTVLFGLRPSLDLDQNLFIYYVVFTMVIITTNAVWFGLFMISFIRKKLLHKIMATLFYALKSTLDFSGLIAATTFILIDNPFIFLGLTMHLLPSTFLNSISIERLYFEPAENKNEFWKESALLIGNFHFFATMVTTLFNSAVHLIASPTVLAISILAACSVVLVGFLVGFGRNLRLTLS